MNHKMKEEPQMTKEQSSFYFKLLTLNAYYARQRLAQQDYSGFSKEELEEMVLEWMGAYIDESQNTQEAGTATLEADT